MNTWRNNWRVRLMSIATVSIYTLLLIWLILSVVNEAKLIHIRQEQQEMNARTLELLEKAESTAEEVIGE